MEKNEKNSLTSRLSGSVIPALFRSRIIDLPVQFDMEDCAGTPFKSFHIRVYDESDTNPRLVEGFPAPIDWYNNVLRVAEQALGYCSGKARFVISFTLDAPVPEPLAKMDDSSLSK